jgi:hypothetical protein
VPPWCLPTLFQLDRKLDGVGAKGRAITADVAEIGRSNTSVGDVVDIAARASFGAWFGAASSPAAATRMTI